MVRFAIPEPVRVSSGDLYEEVREPETEERRRSYRDLELDAGVYETEDPAEINVLTKLGFLQDGDAPAAEPEPDEPEPDEPEPDEPEPDEPEPDEPEPDEPEPDEPEPVLAPEEG